MSGLCEFKSEGEKCEVCKAVIPEGEDIYFSQIPMESDGIYMCDACFNPSPEFLRQEEEKYLEMVAKEKERNPQF